MLKVDVDFVQWMRNRLKDHDYAEQVLRALTGVTDGILVEDAPFPDTILTRDMIATLKGHDPGANKDFILGIFANWHPVYEPMTPFAISMWSLHQPDEIPDLYIAAFMDLDSDQPIVEPVFEGSGIREKKKDDSPAASVTIKKVNFINTRVDSEVLRIITGGVKADVDD